MISKLQRICREQRFAQCWDSRLKAFTAQKHPYDLQQLAAAMNVSVTVIRSKVNQPQFIDMNDLMETILEIAKKKNIQRPFIWTEKKMSYQKWTQEQSDIVAAQVREATSDIMTEEMVSAVVALTNRSASQARNKLSYEMTKRNPDTTKPWSKKDDEQLKTLIMERINKSQPWSFREIGSQLNRPGKQCYNRWHETANPSISKEKPSSAEMLIILQNFQSHGSAFHKYQLNITRSPNWLRVNLVEELFRKGELEDVFESFHKLKVDGSVLVKTVVDSLTSNATDIYTQMLYRKCLYLQQYYGIKIKDGVLYDEANSLYERLQRQRRSAPKNIYWNYWSSTNQSIRANIRL